MDIDTIICGDCLEIMPQIPDKSVNLAILDLPYNINKAEWDKVPEYNGFVANVFTQCERVLKDNGSLYWFHNDFNTIVDIYTWLRDNSRFVFRQFIVWDKFKGAFTHQKQKSKQLRNYPKLVEYILYYTFPPDDSRFVEYMQREKEKAGLKTCSQINRLLGVAEKCGGIASHYFSKKPGFKQYYFPTREKYRRLQTTGYFTRDYDEFRREYEAGRHIYNNQKSHYSVWNYPIELISGHITPKPIRLIENIMIHSSNEGDTVLDPTAGSGTTAVACKRNNRHYICIEKEPEYCAIAEKRIVEML